MSKKVLFLFFSLFTYMLAHAQVSNKFNLNINNGLPNNHVYCVITDKHGYLWIGTTNGVVRYNGYELKTFTVSDGLPTDDVWQLTEDGKGRIWLGSIADRIGYIYNEKYYSAVFKDTGYHTVYPSNLKAKGDNISFFTSYLSGSIKTSFCIEKNDTIFQVSLLDEITKVIPNFHEKNSYQILINANGEKNIIIYENYLLNFIIKDGKVKITSSPQKIDSQYVSDLTITPCTLIGDYMTNYSFNSRRNYFLAYNIRTMTPYKIYLEDIGIKEEIIAISYTADKENNNIYIKTENYIIQYAINKSIKLTGIYNIKNILPDKDINGEKISIFLTDPFWKNCICTNTNGFYLDYADGGKFSKLGNVELKNYISYGSKEGNFIWFNPVNNKICKISPDLKVNYINTKDIVATTKTIDSNMLFMGTRFKNIAYNVAKGKAYLLDNTTFRFKKQLTHTDSPAIVYGIITNGFSRFDTRIYPFEPNILDNDKYNDLAYDAVRHTYWCYNKNKIIQYSQKGIQKFIKDQLVTFGIKTVDKICIDPEYGNIFLKGDADLSMYDYDTKKYTLLFKDINLKEANIAVENHMLIVYGKFGILFSKVLGNQKIASSQVYRNIKNYYYNYIDDAQFGPHTAILNTDMGVYTVEFPTNADIPPINSPAYKIVYNYEQTTTDLHANDTIQLDQKSLALKFDIINPAGNGQLKYTIYANDSVMVLSSGEFNLPTYLSTPDTYYKIYIAAQDRVWKNTPVAVYIYIKPYWWQTHTMRIVIWVSSALLVILLFGASVLITRRLVLNAAKKKSLRMEMELKAIYAQINPHFIFNSLNSALLLISKNNMDEAYAHVSKFSRLLRSYIKSSRNKFISVDEETVNLKNYIALQQMRFKDKFDFDIIVDPLILENGMKIPSLLLQPIVENAIEHGLLNDEKRGQLTIDFKLPENKLLICTITDDGIGRQESKKISEANTTKEVSYGTLLIKDLVKIFNKYENVNVDIGYEDRKAPLTGTVVTIKIKYLTEV